MRKYKQNSIKLSMIFIIFLLCVKTLYSQNTVHPFLYDGMNKTSDSIGLYDLNVFVVGEVELDSLVHVFYTQKYRLKSKYDSNYYYRITYINNYITKKSNIPLIKNHKGNLNTLIYNNDFFDFEEMYPVVLYFIYPQCNEYQKERLDSTFLKGGRNHRMMSANYEIGKNGYSVEHKINKIDKSRKMYYVNIQGKNRYLLVIMNRTWRQGRIVIQSEPQIESDTTNTYIKFLIPLVSLNDTVLDGAK